MASDQQPTPDEAAIRAAHPMISGRHDLYAEAMRLVGARHSKGDLVDLVTWLLLRAEGSANV
jgi:hypothetical protein